jgi:hypothetical protein
MHVTGESEGPAGTKSGIPRNMIVGWVDLRVNGQSWLDDRLVVRDGMAALEAHS